MSSEQRPLVLITGSSGLIGSRLSEHLQDQYHVVGLDVVEPQGNASQAEWVECDLTSDQGVKSALNQVRARFGEQIGSVIHLAAYYDFSGEPSPMYRELTIEGTRRLLRELAAFQVEQFVFSSTLLMMKPSQDDQPLDAFSPVQAEWQYPQSKLETEQVIVDEHGEIATAILRLAGVYDEDCHSLPIAQQIRRIHEKQLESYFFPGDKSHGQAFVHLDDVVDCFRRVLERRGDLKPLEVFLIGEEDVMSYEELQEELGQLLHGQQWPTLRIPKLAAKAGAWVKEQLAGNRKEAPFIKPWMVDLADQNYPVSIARARQELGWEPRHTLRQTLPEMIRRLKEDPRAWYERNGLPLPKKLERGENVGAKK